MFFPLANSAPSSVDQQVSKLLLSWYDRHARDLPWRYRQDQKPDPYRVWLSEVMLQQTTVATVKDYFAKFTSRWPTVKDLASADLDEVLKEWAGLGYYARARNLHKCANVIVTDYQGAFPSHEEDLLKLPGVGPYTAAAISAIAFGREAVAVDVNVERVFARLLNLRTPLPSLKKTIRAEVAPFVPERRSGDYTQALMDLGATLCTPKKPNCLICPLNELCSSNALGIAETLPKRGKKGAKKVRKTLFYALKNSKNELLLERRPERGLLGSMIGFPSSEWVKTDKASFVLGLEVAHLEKSGAGVTLIDEPVEHIFTHFKLEARVGKCGVSDANEALANLFDAETRERLFWWPADKLDQQALPTLMKKVAKVI